MGLSLLREAGLRLVVLSKERNPVVQARCAKVGVEAVTAVDDKIGALRAWMDREDLSMGEVAFVGNDINDLDCLTEAALGVVPADAHPEAVAAANVVMSSPGGAKRDSKFAELLIGAKDYSDKLCPPGLSEPVRLDPVHPPMSSARSVSTTMAISTSPSS